MMRRLRADQAAAHGQERGPTLGRHSRRSEPPGHDRPVLAPLRRIPPHHLGAFRLDPNTVDKPQAMSRLRQEPGSASVGLDKEPGAGWPGEGQGEGRHAAATPEVDD
jgi:hypothetical protein